MATLTQVSITARKTIRYGIFIIIALIVGRIILGLGISIYNKIFPPPPPAPTVAFGKLPKIPFPDQTKTNLNYVLETAEGGLPTLTYESKVYFMPKLSSTLLSLDVTKQKASSLGFATDEEVINSTTYKFQSSVSPSSLTINTVTGSFSISYDLKVDPSPIMVKPTSPEVAAANIRSYLSSADLMPTDLTGPTTYEFLKISGDQFISALSLSDANLIKIHFFRKSYDDLPTLTPDPTKANVWFMVGGLADRDKGIVAAEYHYFPIDESKSATYPIKTAQDAWNEFISGNAYIASLGQNKEGDTVKIRRMYLANYDAGVSVQFFQPIIVFEGDKNFMAYLPAVTSDYYGD